MTNTNELQHAEICHSAQGVARGSVNRISPSIHHKVSFSHHTLSNSLRAELQFTLEH